MSSIQKHTSKGAAIAEADRMAEVMKPWGDRFIVFTLWDEKGFWSCPESVFDPLVDVRIEKGLSVPERIYTT